MGRVMGPFSLLRHRDFRLYFLGNLTSSLGNGMHLLAVNWFVLQRTGSPAAVGLVIAFAFLGGLLILPAGGVVIDRYERRRIAIATDLFRATVVLLVAAAILGGAFHLWQIYAMAMLVSMGHHVFFPAIAAMVQQLVPPEDYARATSLNEVIFQIGTLAAAGAAGLVIVRVGLPGVLVFDGLTYLVSAAAPARVRAIAAPPREGASSFTGMVRDGIRYLAARPAVLVFGLALALPFVATMSLNVLTPAYVSQVLRRGAITFGLFDMTYGVGAFLSGLAAFFAATAAGYALFTSLPGLAGAFLLIGALGFASSSCRVVGSAVMLHLVPPSVMGRTQSTLTLLSTLLQIASPAFVGRLVEDRSLPSGFVMLGLLVAVALVGYLAVARHLRPALQPQAA